MAPILFYWLHVWSHCFMVHLLTKFTQIFNWHAPSRVPRPCMATRRALGGTKDNHPYFAGGGTQNNMFGRDLIGYLAPPRGHEREK